MSLKQKINALIERMKVIVAEQKALGLLQSHAQDFEKFDVEVLQNGYDPSFSYIWIIAPNGTHLTRIGLSKKGNEWADASLRTGYREFSIFLIRDGHVRPITKGQAQDEINKPLEYQVHAYGNVHRGLEKIGLITKKFMRPMMNSGHFDVSIQLDEHRLTRKNVLVMAEIAVSECVTEAQSLFAKINSILINGDDIEAVLKRFNDLEEAKIEVRKHFELV